MSVKLFQTCSCINCLEIAQMMSQHFEYLQKLVTFIYTVSLKKHYPCMSFSFTVSDNFKLMLLRKSGLKGAMGYKESILGTSELKKMLKINIFVSLCDNSVHKGAGKHKI